ncbi:hypothetical protein V6N13_148545 [Hibiscus sabdariffa]
MFSSLVVINGFKMVDRYLTSSLRNEHEVQMKALRCQFEDECKKLQEELSLQKSKTFGYMCTFIVDTFRNTRGNKFQNTCFRDSLSRDIVRGSPNVKWESIKGLENAKRLLKGAIVMPIKYPK